MPCPPCADLQARELDCFEESSPGVSLEFSLGGEFSAFVGAHGEGFAGACYAPYLHPEDSMMGENLWTTSGFGFGMMGGLMAGPSINVMGTLTITYDVSGPYGPGNRWSGTIDGGTPSKEELENEDLAGRTEEKSILKRGWKYGLRPYYDYEMGIGAVLGAAVLNVGLEGGITFDNLAVLLRWIQMAGNYFFGAFSKKPWATIDGLYFTVTAAKELYL